MVAVNLIAYLLCQLFVKSLAQRDVSLNEENFKLSPPIRWVQQRRLSAYRQSIERFYSNSSKHYGRCGIIYSLATANGSLTDFDKLTKHRKAYYRITSVIYEVLLSALKVRASLHESTEHPSDCHGAPDITLFVDRALIDGLSTKLPNLRNEMECLFDHIIYIEDLIQQDGLIPQSQKDCIEEVLRPASSHMDAKSELAARLSSRTNAIKLLSFFSTPHLYSLYLDGDTAPCKDFHIEGFRYLQHDNLDLLVTKNPFGFVSTGGKKVYPGCPQDERFKAFEEINGGVMFLHWTEHTQMWLLRTLELLPYYFSLGYDQDQAVMRHSLFEASFLYQTVNRIRYLQLPMQEYCRYGWQCARNSCKAGCRIVHQRICLDDRYNSTALPLSKRYRENPSCSSVISSVGKHWRYFGSKYSDMIRPTKTSKAGKRKKQRQSKS